MLSTLPETSDELKGWEWANIEPYYQKLEARELTRENVNDWLADWTRLHDLVNLHFSRAHVENTRYTADKEIENYYLHLVTEVGSSLRAAEQRLNQKLLDSGLTAPGMEIALKEMRAETEIFRAENLPLLAEETKLANEYNKISGAQVIEWEGEELTLARLKPLLQNPDRALREKAWRATMQRVLQDREALNQLWVKLLNLRQQIAENAGFDNYRDYRWKVLGRFDYTPEDCETFHAAIEKAVVPAAKRVLERRRKNLGVASVRPWDLDVEPLGRPALRPFESTAELEEKVGAIFNKVDPQLGEFYATMRRENILDLENRKNKAPGAYCTMIMAGNNKRPFVFGNSVGLASDVTTALHECGHAFHVFETANMPFYQQRQPGSEFCEVASMSMELLGSPYLTKSEGGFYTEAEAARARIEHLEHNILFWPYMAVVDAFQQWAYTHPGEASDPANCDRQWGSLWDRFMPGEDWSGLEEEKVTGWHRKLHIYRFPFYYVDYGLAQLGAVQVWGRSLQNKQQAVADYRKALQLGSTVSLPELYAAAGAKFAFDATTLKEAVDLMERTIEQLSEQQQ
ncbi:MAG TPA: M3 family oligoendopeptidase [Chloroflexia bacterium]|nr:M3 family oligoendopeptidase [Chloroflexia bacterium]